MSTLIEFDDETRILMEVASRTDGLGAGVGAVGASDEPTTHRVAKTFEQSLGILREVGQSVRSALHGAKIDEAEVKIGFKASGTGQFIIAATTVEAAIEVTFKIKASH